MRKKVRWASLGGAVALALAGCAGMSSGGATGGAMSFFVTSEGPGKGADLGGIAGADAHCQKLAAAAGAGHRTWHAYLSTQGDALNDTKVTHARDRIGSGPWYNAKGVRIARNVEDLHSPRANVTKETALDERGNRVNGRTEKPNKHDILTGSRPDGTAHPPTAGGRFPDMTCSNWTSSGEGRAMLGHHDRAGPSDHAWATSWNSGHPTIGCSQDALTKTGGAGLFYCFAVK